MMKKEHKIRTQFTTRLAALFVSAAALAVIGFAGGGVASAAALKAPPLPTTFAAACADIKNGNDANNFKGNGSSCIFSNYINPFIKFMTAAMGIIVVISIIVGAIQYISSGGDSGKVQRAKSRINQALIALIMFLFLFGFLQWLVPGGLTG